MALLNKGYRREIEELVRRIEKIETALEPRFQEHFVNAMAFPNKTRAVPQSRRRGAAPGAARSRVRRVPRSGRRRRGAAPRRPRLRA